MTILCANGCHVYRTNEARCTCGQNPSTGSGHGLTKFPLSGGVIPSSYNPYGSPRPPTPPTAGAAPDVSIGQFAAAKLIGSHLSADGKYVYTTRYGMVLQAEWKGGEFGSWFTYGAEMPPDAVAM